MKAKGLGEIMKEDIKFEEEHHFEVRTRELDQSDLDIYEESLAGALSEFCRTLIEIKGMKKAISHKSSKFHLEMISEEFVNEYDQVYEKIPE